MDYKSLLTYGDSKPLETKTEVITTNKAKKMSFGAGAKLEIYAFGVGGFAETTHTGTTNTVTMARPSPAP